MVLRIRVFDFGGNLDRPRGAGEHIGNSQRAQSIAVLEMEADAALQKAIKFCLSRRHGKG